MRPAFIVTNVILFSVIGAAGWLGLLSPLLLMPHYEIVISCFVALLWAFGIGAALLGKTKIVYHIANGLPMYGLAGTGISIILAITSVHALNSTTAFDVFRAVGLSLAINFEGIIGMIWLRELAFWDQKEHI